MVSPGWSRGGYRGERGAAVIEVTSDEGGCSRILRKRLRRATVLEAQTTKGTKVHEGKTCTGSAGRRLTNLRSCVCRGSGSSLARFCRRRGRLPNSSPARWWVHFPRGANH